MRQVDYSKALDALTCGRDRIASVWTPDWFARDASGNPVFGDSPDAIRWDLIGAVHRESGSDDALQVIVSRIPNRQSSVVAGQEIHLFEWCRGLSQEQALEFYDGCIQECESNIQ